MAGTREGGMKTAERNKAKYGSDFYALIGKRGGEKGTKENGSIKGFAQDPERARKAGILGGTISRRGKVDA